MRLNVAELRRIALKKVLEYTGIFLTLRLWAHSTSLTDSSKLSYLNLSANFRQLTERAHFDPVAQQTLR